MGLKPEQHNPSTVELRGDMTGIPLLSEGVLKRNLSCDPGVTIDGVDLSSLDIAGTSLASHVAESDPHPGYRLESADHTHQSTGAEGGKLDHGAALTGLTDDDHTQYIKHALATATSDFLVGASGGGSFEKKTLAETKVILGASALSSKIITSSRDLSAGDGDVSYTGVGFQPTALVLLAGTDAATIVSVGIADSARGQSNVALAGTYAGTIKVNTSSWRLYKYNDVTAYATVALKSYDSDGFTLTYTKTGSPTGTVSLMFLCLK